MLGDLLHLVSIVNNTQYFSCMFYWDSSDFDIYSLIKLLNLFICLLLFPPNTNGACGNLRFLDRGKT